MPFFNLMLGEQNKILSKQDLIELSKPQEWRHPNIVPFGIKFEDKYPTLIIVKDSYEQIWQISSISLKTGEMYHAPKISILRSHGLLNCAKKIYQDSSSNKYTAYRLKNISGGIKSSAIVVCFYQYSNSHTIGLPTIEEESSIEEEDYLNWGDLQKNPIEALEDETFVEGFTTPPFHYIPDDPRPFYIKEVRIFDSRTNSTSSKEFMSRDNIHWVETAIFFGVPAKDDD